MFVLQTARAQNILRGVDTSKVEEYTKKLSLSMVGAAHAYYIKAETMRVSPSPQLQDDECDTEQRTLSLHPPPPRNAHQQRVIDACFDPATGAPLSGIVCSPPGSGKTVCMMHAASRLPHPSRILCITATCDLVDQLCTHWRSATVGQGGTAVYAWPNWEIASPEPSGVVVVSTYAALVHASRSTEFHIQYQRLRSVRWDAVILDEVHLVPAQTTAIVVQDILQTAVVAWGCTGTLLREDNGIQSLSTLVGPTLLATGDTTTADSGIVTAGATSTVSTEAPIVSRSIIRVPPWTSPSSSATDKGWHRRFLMNPHKASALCSVIESHPQCIAVMVFVERVDALAPLEHVLHTHVTSHTILGSVSSRSSRWNRSRLLEKLRTATTPSVLLLTDIGTLGIDVPCLSLVIELSADKSRSKFQQRVGRVQRLCANKPTAATVTIVTAGRHEDVVGQYRSQGESCADVTAEHHHCGGGGGGAATEALASALLRIASSASGSETKRKRGHHASATVATTHVLHSTISSL